MKPTELQKMVTSAEILAARKGGLPGDVWLLDYGYDQLHDFLIRYPEAFAHIERQIDKRRNPKRKVKPRFNSLRVSTMAEAIRYARTNKLESVRITPSSGGFVLRFR